jgi:hypothetical protein
MLSYLQSFHVDSRHEDLEMYTFDRIVGHIYNKHNLYIGFEALN